MATTLRRLPDAEVRGGVTATPLVFSNYTSPGGARVDSSAAVLVTCTPAYLLLDCKTSYTLPFRWTFRPAARSARWPPEQAAWPMACSATACAGSPRAMGRQRAGSGRNHHHQLAQPGLPAGNKSHTIHGRIPANQNVRAGAYTDSVVLTVTY